MPGETLEKGIQNIFVLGEHQGLILKSSEKFIDDVSPFVHNHSDVFNACVRNIKMAFITAPIYVFKLKEIFLNKVRTQ